MRSRGKVGTSKPAAQRDGQPDGYRNRRLAAPKGIILAAIASVLAFILGTGVGSQTGLPADLWPQENTSVIVAQGPAIEDVANEVPAWDGYAFCQVGDGIPDFDVAWVASVDAARDYVAHALPHPSADYSQEFESYSELDELGRCGACVALIGPQTLPQRSRESISSIKPTGWQSSLYDFIDGQSLYNRSHLIAWCLAEEDLNPCDLITGTRYMNATGMLAFEERMARYVESAGNHILLRVTPCFVGDELIARGVRIEAMSIEDAGYGIRFDVWIPNVQPGVSIDYATGDNHFDEKTLDWGMTPAQAAASALATFNLGQKALPTGAVAPVTVPEGDGASPQADQDEAVSGDLGIESSAGAQVDESLDPEAFSTEVRTYVLNVRTMRVHLPDCSALEDTKDKNKLVVEASMHDLVAQGYEPCGICKP